MKRYKTLKAFLNHLEWINEHSPHTMKGFQKLTDKQIEALAFLMAQLSNDLGDFERSSHKKTRRNKWK